VSGTACTGTARRIERVRKRIETAARSAGRAPEEIRLIAVSKMFPPESVLEAVCAGLRTFGENRIQEATAKIPIANEASAVPLEWHLVGALQRNKAARAVELFSVIHSLDRRELADALSRAAQGRERTVQVLLQVNVDREPQKAGAAPETVEALLEHVEGLPGLEPVGLMAIPRLEDDPEQTRPAFATLRRLREALNSRRSPDRHLPVLSMGMSSDFEIAIQEGADWIRIGTAIFGERSPA
jgi:pyridoxal phosphate enzyme (YggS family)